MWAAVLGLLAAVGIVLGVALDPGSPDENLGDASAAQAVSAAGEPRRCLHCGWIESKREIVPAAADTAAPRIYEYTVRMSNGSSSVFREQLPVSWRVGERLIFIDGEKKN
jgi:hypothetical protein